MTTRGTNATTHPLPRPPTDREFRLFQGLILEESGIHLTEVKRALLAGRLMGRIRALGFRTFGEYHDHVLADPAERVRMLDLITTNETRFFREPRHFEFLEARVFPAWEAAAAAGRRSKTIRVWSAACSTGEEPYTLAMILLARFPPTSGWELDILATDLSTRVLARAKEATWPIAKAHEIPEHHRKAFMLRGVRSQEGLVRAAPELRASVRFERLNLHAPEYPVTGRFDLVFCRNVLIYFEPRGKVAVAERLLGHLTPEGLLVLGHAESLAGLVKHVKSFAPGVYGLASAAPSVMAEPASRSRATAESR